MMRLVVTVKSDTDVTSDWMRVTANGQSLVSQDAVSIANYTFEAWVRMASFRQRVSMTLKWDDKRSI